MKMRNAWTPALAATLGAVLLGALAREAVRAADPAPQGAEAWPQLLGPERNNASRSTGLFAKDKPVRLRVLWRRPSGTGVSGLSVESGRVVTLESDGEKDAAVALDAATGKPHWRVTLDPVSEAADQGPSSTPAIGHGLAFVLTPVCQLRALDLASGEVKWHVDLKARFNAVPRRGCSSSALLDGDRIILHSGAADDHRTLALSAKTGEPVWTAKGVARSTYASPAIAQVGGERLLLVQHVDAADPSKPLGGFTALRPKDGSVAWHTTIDQNWSWEVPVALGGDRVLFLTWNDVTAFRAPAAGETAPKKLWQTADLRANASPPVLHGDHLYGFSGDFLTAVRASDGVKVWAEKLYPGSLLLADGHLVVMSAVSGVLRVVEASPAGYKERASLEALARGARADTSPSIAGRRIYVRNDEEIVAVEVES